MIKKLLLIFFLTSCSSISEKIVQKADDQNRPNWATTTKSTWLKDGKIYAVGFHETDAENRLSSVLRVADNNARYEVSRTITNEMAFVFQNMEEGADEASSLVRFYGAEVSKVVLAGVTQEQRYWEKVLVRGIDDDDLKLRSYSLISIPLATLKKATKEIVDQSRGLDPKIKEQMNDHLARELQKLGSH